MTLNPYVWLPHFEFTLQTIAVQYPKKPNELLRKSIMNLLVIYQYFSNKTIEIFFKYVE